MKKSTQIIIIITRMYCSKGNQSDEFVTLWQQPVFRKYSIIRNLPGQYLAIIHGHKTIYDLDPIEKAIAGFASTIQEILKELPKDIYHYKLAILFHPLSTDKTFIKGFRETLYATFKEDTLKSVQTYGTNHPNYHQITLLAKALITRENSSAAFEALWHTFIEKNKRLERHLRESHETLRQNTALYPISQNPPPENVSKRQTIFVAWNHHPSPAFLRQAFPEANILTSRAALNTKLKSIKNLLILAELTWENHALSDGYGYELAKELIEKGYSINISFASFLSRSQLKQTNPAAAILVSLFSHLQLHTSSNNLDSFKIPQMTGVDWEVIRQCYISQAGLWDRILHDIQKLVESPARKPVRNILQEIQTHANMFPSAILEYSAHIFSHLDTAPIFNLRPLLKRLYEQLEILSQQQTVQQPSKIAPSPYQLMLVEDNPATLEALKKGFAEHFQVKGFTDGTLALAELKKNKDEYAALLLDLELLDSEGNWQRTQGHHIIKAIQTIPHLVVYMLTCHSKHFVSVVQRALQRSPEVMVLPGYIPKHPVLGLRPDYSYAEFSRALIKEIHKKSGYQQGPRLGLWTKGMLQTYYRLKASEEGKNLWEEAIQSAERCISEGNNASGAVPQVLFSTNTRQFDHEKIKLILSHRLLCLYLQYDDNKIEFERGIKTLIQFKQSNPRKYFSTLLGFSTKCETEINTNGRSFHTCYIQKKHLFTEEIKWLQKMFPSDPTLRYPGLIEVLSDALSNPILTALGICDQLKSIDSLADCEKFFQKIVRVPKAKAELIIDLQWYKQYFTHEFKQLQQDNTTQKLVNYIQEFSGNAT